MNRHVWYDIPHELRELTNLKVHLVISDIENLTRDLVAVTFHCKNESAHHIVDMDEWPPLVTSAHDINQPLFPCAKRHNINREIETHSWREAKHRRVAQNDRFKVRPAELA